MKTTQTTQEITNDIRYSFNKVIGNKHYFVKIRLNDECKNGHEDFAITGDIYEAGKPKNDRNMISCGAIGDEIAQKMPRFKMFNDLHLAQFSGIPMYAIENGFYHLQQGFNNTKPTDANFKAEFCEYYRINPELFDLINVPEKDYFKYQLIKLGIVENWGKQAIEAIKVLEELTGKTFQSSATRAEVISLSPKEIKSIEAKIKKGYYTPEQIKARQIEKNRIKAEELRNKLTIERDRDIAAINGEFNVKIALLDLGFSIDNFIYYKHTNKGVFNWKGYEKQITVDDLADVIRLIDYSKLPENITFEIENKK